MFSLLLLSENQTVTIKTVNHHHHKLYCLSCLNLCVRMNLKLCCTFCSAVALKDPKTFSYVRAFVLFLVSCLGGTNCAGQQRNELGLVNFLLLHINMVTSSCVHVMFFATSAAVAAIIVSVFRRI